MPAEPEAIDPGTKITIVKKQEAQRKHKIIQERIVRRQNDSNLKRRQDQEADQAAAAGKNKQPAEAEFCDEGEKRQKRLKRVRQLLRVPADPGGQRAVLVILVHRRQMAPLGIVAGQLGDAGFKVNSKPLPLEQEQAGRRCRTGFPQPGAKSRRREEQREESRSQQHAVGLIIRKIARGGDEGEKSDQRNGGGRTRPDVQKERHGRNQPGPDQHVKRKRSASQPEQRGRNPVSKDPHLTRDVGKIIARGKNSVGTHQAVNLKCQRVKRRKEDHSKRAQE